MRRRGVLTSGRHLRGGDHVCWTHTGGVDWSEIVTGVLAEGMAENQRLVYLGPEHLRDALPPVIGQEDTSELIDSGRLVCVEAESLVRPEGIDAQALLSGLASMAGDALADGFSGLRVVGEAGWLLSQVSARPAFMRFEVRSEISAAQLPVVLFCSYDTRALDAAAVGLVRSVHPLVLPTTSRTSADLGFTLTARDGTSLMLEGEIDARSAETLAYLLAGGSPGCDALDLTGLRFADVAGVRAVAEGARALRDAAGAVRLIGASPVFRRLWTLLGFDGTAGISFADA